MLDLNAAQVDRDARAALHARHCVCLALVTPPTLAADLIDEAVKLRAAARSSERGAAEKDGSTTTNTVASTSHGNAEGQG